MIARGPKDVRDSGKGERSSTLDTIYVHSNPSPSITSTSTNQRGLIAQSHQTFEIATDLFTMVARHLILPVLAICLAQGVSTAFNMYIDPFIASCKSAYGLPKSHE
jgi:hypothetical protein